MGVRLEHSEQQAQPTNDWPAQAVALGELLETLFGAHAAERVRAM